MKHSEWKPNPSATAPLYEQIKDYLETKIINGDWPVGTKLPPQRRLAAMFDVNRSTVVTALDELTAQGLIAGNSGGGTKVINHTWNVMAANPPPDWHSYVKAGVFHPNLPTIQEINEAEFSPDVIRLGTGELSPTLLPTAAMQDIFQRLPNRMTSLGYEEPKGNLFLRKQIAHYLKKWNIDAAPSSILIVSGALQAFQLISIGLLQRSSTILLERPSYLYSLRLFQSAGMKLFGIPMDEDGLQASFIAKYKAQSKAAMLYTIPCFHNPTGTSMTEARRTALLEVCEKEGLPLMEDDVYRELWIDEPPPLPLKSRDRSGLVLYLGSMSKTLSPGLRIGWVIGPEPVINRLADIKMQTDYGASSLSQWAVAEWLVSGLYDQHIHFVREQLKIRRDAALQALYAYFSPFATWTVPKGGFYIWVHITPPLSMRQLFEAALKERILIHPGHLYDPQATQSLRISYAYASLTDLEKGIARLSSLVKQAINHDKE